MHHVLFFEHGIIERLRLEQISGSHLVQSTQFKLDYLQQLAQDILQEVLQGRQHSGQPISLVSHWMYSKVFPDVQRKPPVSCFVPIAPDPVFTGHY